MKTKRILMSVLGVFTGAASVGFFKLAAFGVDPFQATMSGFEQLFPIGLGPLYVIVNVCLLLFALIFDRHYIGIATFINLFLLGYVVDAGYDDTGVAKFALLQPAAQIDTLEQVFLNAISHG